MGDESADKIDPTTEPKTSIQCPNCETTFTGNYCPECGQSTREWHRPIRDLSQDLLSSFFQWDSRLFHTLRHLFTNPGKLSKDYIEGKRTRFVPPLRLYIASSLLFFFIVSVFSKDLQESFQNIQVDEETATELDKELEKSREEGNTISIFFLEGSKKILENPSAFLDKIIRNLPKAAFFLLPVFSLLHFLVMIRHDRYFIDFILYSIHFHSLAFFILSIYALLDEIPSLVSGFYPLLLLSLPIYFLVGFKSFNGDRWVKTIFKSLFVSAAYGFILIISILLYLSLLLAI